MTDRILKIQLAVSGAGLDAILLRGAANRFYATGFRSSSGVVIVTLESAYFFTDSRYIEAARAQIEGLSVGLLDQNTRERDAIRDVCNAESVLRLGLEDSMSHGDFLRFNEILGGLELVPSEDLILPFRASKDTRERDAIIAATRISEAALSEVLPLIRPGVTEREVAAELVYRQLRLGAERMSFEPIVVSGVRSSMPHGTPSDKQIESGDFVTMDFGCVKDGYCSDITRTVAVGNVSDEMRRVYATVLEAQLAGIAAARPGNTGKAIDAKARDVIEAAGYGEYFGHSFGHSLGIEVHETPNASPTEAREMPEGAVISAEPGIYLPGKFGVRIEDTLYLTGGGCENLVRADKTLTVL